MYILKTIFITTLVHAAKLQDAVPRLQTISRLALRPATEVDLDASLDLPLSSPKTFTDSCRTPCRERFKHLNRLGPALAAHVRYRRPPAVGPKPFLHR